MAMAKLQDMFRTQARQDRAEWHGGFLGRNRPTSKAHAAALVVPFHRSQQAMQRTALKAGADGLFSDGAARQSIARNHKEEIDSAKNSE